ncbi:MAG: hypothetical protein WCS03_01700 [Bacteroidota bacterium]
MENYIKQFGPQQLDVLRNEIQSAFDAIKSKYGLSKLSLGNISFNLSSFTGKISGEVVNPEKGNYEQYEAEFFAMKHGLPQDFIGSEFLMESSVYKITHIVTSRPRFPIIAHCDENGKTFKFTVPRIKELLETNRVINIPYKDEETN